jgi:transposase
VVPRVRERQTDRTVVPALLHATFAAACDEIDMLEARMLAIERQLASVGAQLPDGALLQTIPGVGLITATALTALVTDIYRFPSGRLFARPYSARRGMRRSDAG